MVLCLPNSKMHFIIKQPRGRYVNSIEGVNAHVQFLKLELYALFNIMFIIELYLIKLKIEDVEKVIL